MSSQASTIADAAQALLKQAADRKMTSIKSLTETRHTVLELQSQLAEAQRADAQAYAAALRGGWTEDELRKIGVDKPKTGARPSRPAARKGSAHGAAITASAGGAAEGGTGAANESGPEASAASGVNDEAPAQS